MAGKLKAGFIGYRNFALKLKELFGETNAVGEFLFFHPDKKLEGLNYTNKFEDLLGCDFIVIASPDETHGQYLRQLKDFKKYIFCEKIPVITKEDFEFLRENPNPKLYFDFGFRKSKLYSTLKDYSEKILHIQHNCCHGLALKEEYKNNWRSQASKTPLGVFQLSGIHFFDLLVFSFGEPKSYKTAARNLSPHGDSIDNFNINIEFQNGITADLYYSYTAPFCLTTEILTKDEIIRVDDQSFSVYGPRETFDKNGRFAPPKLISEEKSDLYKDSLKDSVNYFIKIVQTNGVFQEATSENNLLSTKLFLEILENRK